MGYSWLVGESSLDDPGCCRGDLSKGMNVSHDIVPSLLLLCRSDSELLLVEILPSRKMIIRKQEIYLAHRGGLEDQGETHEISLHLLNGIVWNG